MKEGEMKKIVVLVAMIVLIVAGVGYAESQKKAAPQQAKAAEVSADQMAEMLAKKKAELNGTEWNIKLTPMGGGHGKAENDVLSFVNDKVTSKNLEQSGYVSTNFSVRLLEDGTFTWETMQTSEKEGVAFWRGDISPDGVMRGVISKRDKKDNASDFNFVSVSTHKVAPVEPQPVPVKK